MKINEAKLQETTFCWYALSADGDVLIQGETRDSVIDSNAFYYVEARKYTPQKAYNGSILNNLFLCYETFDKAFKPYPLKYIWIKCDTNIYYEKWFQQGPATEVPFKIYDRLNSGRIQFFQGGIEAIKSCIDYMKYLNQFKTWQEKYVTDEAIRLKAQVAELKNSNEALQSRLNEILENRNDFNNLHHILFHVKT